MGDKLFYTNEELPQGSDEWKAVRMGCIGGSEIASMLDISLKIDSPFKLWQRKTGKIGPKKFNKAMERGNAMEEEARVKVLEWLQENEGIKNPQAVPIFAKHPEYPFLAVSFDGVDVENKFITELKCPNYAWNFKTVLEDGIQDYYYPQVQLQLDVAYHIWGIDRAYFGSYFPDGVYVLDRGDFIERLKRLAVIDVEYDPEFSRQVAKVGAVFWDFVERDYWEHDKYDKTLEEFKKYYNGRV